jgi:hypothetical protein
MPGRSGRALPSSLRGRSSASSAGSLARTLGLAFNSQCMPSASNTPLSSSNRAARRPRSESQGRCSAHLLHREALEANDWSSSEQAQPLVAVGSRSLTQQAPVQPASRASSCTPGKAQNALPSCPSGATAADYGSRYRLLRDPARSTAGPWSSSRPQRGAGSARRAFGESPSAGLPSARPNPSLKLTRYGRPCKPGPRQSYYRRVPGLQVLPTRAA